MSSLPTLSGGSIRWASGLSRLACPQPATPLPHLQVSSPNPTTPQGVLYCSPFTGRLTSRSDPSSPAPTLTGVSID